jgi:hypothetical protein
MKKKSRLETVVMSTIFLRMKPNNSAISIDFKPFLKRGIQMYHLAYVVPSFEVTIQHLLENKAIMLREPSPSVAFSGKKICFLCLPNRFIVEMIES